MKRNIIFIIFIIFGMGVSAQIDSSLLRNQPFDTLKAAMNIDAIYTRPFLAGNQVVALGGYIESDYQYMGTDGITEGHQFSIPRMTLFVASSLHHRIRFLSELEIEDGGKEISLEFAALDIMFHPLLNFRAGVIMNPIGAFNQNHDGPKWEFTEKPLAMNQMLPATWSNIGFGLYGKYFKKHWAFAYEACLSNGFDGSIIDNEMGKTWLPASKENKERFTESSNGKPLATMKIGMKYRNFEFGLSYMGGIYNQTEEDGIFLMDQLRLNIWDVDFNFRIPEIQIIGEFAFVGLDVPTSYTQQYAGTQSGGFMDIIVPVYQRPLFSFPQLVVNLALRVEYLDWNMERFRETNSLIGDQTAAIVPGISVRPIPLTVLRLNYRFMSHQDLFRNPASYTRGIQVGIASYF